ncbi:MAG: cytochrome o ubiquinol oxidase subunit IV [Candidatus Saccharimonadales bacterium]
MGTYRSYITGFGLSLLLTVAAFGAVWAHLGQGLLSVGMLIAVLAVLAAAQLMVQLLFFLHLAEEKSPRWNLLSLLFAGMVLLVIVGGSLWIMKHLDYHMSPTDAANSIMHDEGFSH